MALQTDTTILHEIVRVVESRARVPEKVRLRGYEYQITYLDDHKQRLEETLRRRDPDRLNMLYGQLASKVKYQLLRRVPARATKSGGGSSAKKRSAGPRGAKKASGTTGSRGGRAAKKASPAKAQRVRPVKKTAAKKTSGSGPKRGKPKKTRVSRAARS